MDPFMHHKLWALKMRPLVTVRSMLSSFRHYYYQDHTWSKTDKACHNSVLVVDNWLTKLIQNNHFWSLTTIISFM